MFKLFSFYVDFVKNNLKIVKTKYIMVIGQYKKIMKMLYDIYAYLYSE